VFRDSSGQPLGLLALIALDRIRAEDTQADPAIRAAWVYLQHKAPLRPGEKATYFRFWMAQDTYQAVSPVQSRIFLNIVQHYLTTPGLAFTFLPCADPAFWISMFAYADLGRIEAADFSLDGKHYGVFGHDWRVVPPLAWLSLMADREIAISAAMPTRTAEPLIVLSESDFATAVRDALRDFTTPETLKRNPLLQSRLIAEHAGSDSSLAKRVTALQELLQESAASLQQSPRQTKFFRVLYHTYFQPAATQEQAAEILDLPFSTYRRHLRTGIAYVTEHLWQQELGSLVR
jgi:hypothetical protein